jgi:hypothetical protein
VGGHAVKSFLSVATTVWWKRLVRLGPGFSSSRSVVPPLQSRVVGTYAVRAVWLPYHLSL